jgi:hypothetical protein
MDTTQTGSKEIKCKLCKGESKMKNRKDTRIKGIVEYDVAVAFGRRQALLDAAKVAREHSAWRGEHIAQALEKMAEGER